MRAFILLASLSLTACVQGQPIGVQFTTVESRVATADQVVLATIDELVIVPPQGDDAKHYAVTLKVQETIKGEVQERVTNLRPVRLLGFDQRFDQWKAAQKVLLCFIQNDARSWTYHPLGEPVEAEERFKRYPLAPTFAQDLSLLTTEQEVVDRAREYSRTTATEKPIAGQATISMRMPHAACVGLQTASWNDVVLPVDRALERLAHRLIREPEQFLPKEASRRPFPRYQLRMGGVQCLRFFKSPANIELLQDVLSQPLTAFEDKFKPLRIEALETLLAWGVELDLPKFAFRIETLRLCDPNVTNRTLAIVGKMKSLTTLDLRGAKISAEGLWSLSGLRDISLIDLSSEQLTDESVQALREMKILHTISGATTKRDEGRPTSPEHVVSLTLWDSPVTDAAMKEFEDFKNLIYLDLRKTKVTGNGIAVVASPTKLRWLHLEGSYVTDADLKTIGGLQSLRILGLGGLPITDVGLMQLAGLTQLTHIRLGGTKVTSNGIAELQHALPRCKIILKKPE